VRRSVERKPRKKSIDVVFSEIGGVLPAAYVSGMRARDFFSGVDFGLGVFIFFVLGFFTALSVYVSLQYAIVSHFL
jgi:hypothetical protein